MDGKTFSENYNESNVGDNTNKEMNGPATYSDPYSKTTPIDVAPISEIPVNVIEVAPVAENRLYSAETPVVETPAPAVFEMGTGVVGRSMDNPIVSEKPLGETKFHEEATGPAPIPPAPLLDHEESEHFRNQWNAIQGKFVDEPRAAVQQADLLVSEVVAKITQIFANEHNSLEGQWNQGNNVSTEDLRMSLQHYRSFFNRLVI